MKEGGARKEPEQEEPGRTQAAATMTAHGQAKRGRSHGGGMATNSSGAGGGERWSQGWSGGPRQSRWCGRRRRGSRGPQWSRSNRGLRRSGGDGWSLKEPEGRGAAGGVKSRGAGRLMPDQGGAGGTREPGLASGPIGHGREEGARSHGGAEGLTGGGRVKGYFNPSDAGGWQSRGARTVLIGSWGRAEGLPDERGRHGQVGTHLWALRTTLQDKSPLLAGLGDRVSHTAGLGNRSPSSLEDHSRTTALCRLSLS